MSLAIPVRYPEGVTCSFPNELLAKYGNPNPFQLHRWEDDFDWLGATGVKYTLTAPNSGTVAKAAGDGGRVLFTTGATIGNPAALQLVSAGFTPALGKRMWFAARFQVAGLTVPNWAAGLIQTTTTIGTVTDGIVFEKATGVTAITLKHYVGSAATLSLTIPIAGLLPLVDADFDLGFYLDEKGYLYGFGATVANGGLFGYFPQNDAAPNRSALVGGQVPALTTVDLNPTLGIVTQAGSAITMNADFIMAAKERA